MKITHHPIKNMTPAETAEFWRKNATRQWNLNGPYAEKAAWRQPNG